MEGSQRIFTKPTLGVIKNFPEALNTTAGFLLGESSDMNVSKDSATLKCLNELEKWTTKIKHTSLK
ncbi:hypothetical protein [uncultured Chryseobacterium sp.]|uniref:hypothetical protein n=1 Tax=uncultured Chryseobacterium sp. TaxID=259322 RepID=UPI0025E5B0A4|nr:hypothetical protein [uncultured Chryseobacterium sp.]